jgi:predicted ribosomally synthesized peptide with nif11-like leader
MSKEQLAALLAKLKDDAGLQAKLKAATNLDSVLAIAKDAGFVISKAVWLKFQAQQTIEMSDEELENVAGAKVPTELPTENFGYGDLRQLRDNFWFNR